MFELLPGTGLALPRGAGVLRFGMPEREAQWAVATLADVRETWICQAGWAFAARYEGLDLLVYGDCADRSGRDAHDRAGLDAVHLSRAEPGPTGPSAVPVVLRGIDVFGYPAAEVRDALGDDPHATVRLTPPGSPGYLASAHLSSGPRR
ncbi:hypothetical protein [Streptomyces sp. NPDC050504]|uniref:hypothetical protein n=1 Tax=Streptomyces sp. NPDC050504 TaxID=3365618 RepID=UPI0037A30DC8